MLKAVLNCIKIKVLSPFVSCFYTYDFLYTVTIGMFLHLLYILLKLEKLRIIFFKNTRALRTNFFFFFYVVSGLHKWAVSQDFFSSNFFLRN